MSAKRFPIAEIYGPVLQGEGYVQGRRTMFVRIGGCDGADGRRGWCQWCDSMLAVDPVNKASWKWLTALEIMEQLTLIALTCRTVTISGGNPVLLDLTPLIAYLRFNRYFIAVETQGTLYKPWLDDCHVVTLSPKPPSSGFTADLTKFAAIVSTLKATLTKPVLKIVVDPEFPGDYRFAANLAKQWSAIIPTYFLCYTAHDDTPESLLNRYRALEYTVVHDVALPDVHVGVQFHALVHGVGLRGI